MEVQHSSIFTLITVAITINSNLYQLVGNFNNIPTSLISNI